MGNRFKGILIALTAFMGLSALMIQMYGQPDPKSKKSVTYPKGVVTRLAGTGEWIRPEASAEELAEKLTVEQLIDRWNRWPQQPRKEGIHLVYASSP